MKNVADWDILHLSIKNINRKNYKQALDEIEEVVDDYNRVEKLRNIIEMVSMLFKT